MVKNDVLKKDTYSGKKNFTIPFGLIQYATQFAHLSVYQRWIKSANSLTQHIIKTSCSRSGIF